MSRVQALALVETPPRPAGCDATVLVQRVGSEIASLAQIVASLQLSLGPAIWTMAESNPGLMVEAQKLDLVEQTLRDLGQFMARVGRYRVGQDSLPLEDLTATLTLAGLATRLSGETALENDDELDLF